MTGICALDASELARMIGSREVSPIEALRAHQERIAARNPALNAVVTPNPRAAVEARRAERALVRGDPLGPLHGVPFTVKDSFDAAGLRATRGSALFTHHVAAGDATVVRRMRESGAVLLGKTNVPEFVLWAETDNLVFGPTVHPCDPARTPGGSSGGEAAAIATGMSPLGIGSDLSGSIRLPAHYCGIVGFKPTHGRVPLTGHWPETLRRFTHVGPMARSVRDVRLALGSMAGPDGRDPYSELPPGRGRASRPVSQLRVGFLAGRAFGPLEPEVADAVEAAAQDLSGAVCGVEAVSVPVLENCDYDLLTVGLYGAEGGPYFADIVDGRTGELHPVLRRRLEQPAPSLPEYLAAENAVDALTRGLMAIFEDLDVLVCPVGPVTAPLRDRSMLVVDGAEVRSRSVLRATLPFDLAGVPAVSVPYTLSREGFPIGVQVVGPRFADETVLDVGELLVRQAGYCSMSGSAGWNGDND